MLGYLALSSLFLLFFSPCFYFGMREWLSPRDDSPLPVDLEYVRRENYFGESFRAKMGEWMRTARRLAPSQSGDGSIRAVLEKPDGERILLLAGGFFAPPAACRELVYSEGDLRLPQCSVFHKEIYALGGVETGSGAQLQSIAANGKIELGPDNEIAGWVDSHRSILLRRGTVVHRRVSSLESIEFEPGVSVNSLYAPLILTCVYDSNRNFSTGCLREPGVGNDGRRKARPGSSVPASENDLPDYLGSVSCRRMSASTWLVQGNLKLPRATCVSHDLVVQGMLHCGPDCCFHGSIKARRVELGPNNRVAGNLVSGSTLDAGPDSYIGRSAIAEEDIVLRAGVRVGGIGSEAVVSAGGNVMVETNLRVCGKIAAGGAVVTL